MKKTSIVILLSLATFIFLVSCGNNTSTSNDMHTHADGTVHEGATHTGEPVAQESFQAEAEPCTDSGSMENHEHNHDHQGHSGHKH